jgi:hypothetical protein
MSTEIQVVGSGLIKFEFLVQRLGSREAARDAFENLTEDLVAIVHPDVRAIRANPGDWGIDVFVGALTRGGEVYVWQSKYFIDGFGKTQQGDVRDSYNSAKKAAQNNGYTLKAWTLCIPITLDAPSLKWWQGWVKRNKADGIEKRLWDEGALRRKINTPAAADLRNAYFAPAFVLPGETELDANMRALRELENGNAYEEALFVHQMQVANMTETFSAREAFFNAEILTQEIGDKAIPEEVAALRAWRMKVNASWAKRFNDALQAVSAGDQLPGLYKDVMDEIEGRHESDARGLRASPIHGFGLMHQTVEGARAGWVREWRMVADAFDRASVPSSSDTDNIHVLSTDVADTDATAAREPANPPDARYAE